MIYKGILTEHEVHSNRKILKDFTFQRNIPVSFKDKCTCTSQFRPLHFLFGHFCWKTIHMLRALSMPMQKKGHVLCIKKQMTKWEWCKINLFLDNFFPFLDETETDWHFHKILAWWQFLMFAEKMTSWCWSLIFIQQLAELPMMFVVLQGPKPAIDEMDCGL